jgi:hypothetical protein
MSMRVQHQLSRICAGIPRRTLGALAVSFLVLVVAGCVLVSGTIRIEHDFKEGPQQSTGQNVKEMAVDLNVDSDFKDNKDNIKSVDEVGFVFQAINNLSTGATGQIYASKLPISPLTAAQIRLMGKLVVNGLVLSAGPGVATDISYDQSLAHEVNQDFLHDLVKDGTFYLYGIASQPDFDITIQKNTAVVVVTVEL